MANLKKNIVGGVFWTAFETVINKGFDFVIQLFLARLLFPEDYGIVGMAVVFIAFLEVLNDLGLGAALIQKKGENLTSTHLHTAFWSGLIWSFLIYGIIYFLITPFSVSFYNEPKLALILPVMSISMIITPVNLIHRVLLTRDMNFKKLTFISSTSTILSGSIALTLAFLDYGVWALVAHSLFKVVFAIPLFFRATKYKPSLIWDKNCFKEIFGFGIYTTGTAISNRLAQKMDYLLVGKFVGSVALGYYTFAFLITNILRNQIVNILNKVMYPVYTKIQDDVLKMKKLYLQILTLNNMLVYPLIFFLFLFADYIIPFLFGAKWNNSIFLIKILSVSVLVQMLNNSTQPLFWAYGKAKLKLQLDAIRSFGFFLPLILLGVYWNGVLGVAIAFTIATFFSMLLTNYYLYKLFNISFLETIVQLKASLLMIVISYVLVTLSLLTLHWGWCICIYFVCIVGTYYLFAGKEIISLLKMVKNRTVK